MGRRAKYFTLEEKWQLLVDIRNHICSQNSKIVRQAQNARAYTKHHSRHGPHTTLKDLHNPLPSSILQFANLPLPNSYLFRQLLNGSDLIDVSDLSQWDKAPPYNSLPPPDSPEEQRFTPESL
ncbi:hypothetical protein DFH29DRAFT_876524 [Suillus ampliporus]|nr:hypothetical protein DFH29DRAFT_876524 [Suillus ampliporus]